MSPLKVLILGGVTEAIDLAALLDADSAFEQLTSRQCWPEPYRRWLQCQLLHGCTRFAFGVPMRHLISECGALQDLEWSRC